VASTAVNKNYDIGTLIGDTSYTVGAFTLSPSGSSGTITYADVSSITGVAFDSSSRTFTWPTLGTGTYTLKMQGSLTGSTSVTTSFSLSITETTISVTNSPTDQSYDIGTTVGTTSYKVPDFTSNPAGATISYTDASASLPTDVSLTGTTYSWTNLKTVGTYTIAIKGILPSSKSVTASFKLTITKTTISVATVPTDQTYDIGTCSGLTSYYVPVFTTNPSGATITYSDVTSPKITDVSLSGTTYDWSLLKTVGTYTLTI
jgi:hypothetical protein